MESRRRIRKGTRNPAFLDRRMAHNFDKSHTRKALAKAALFPSQGTGGKIESDTKIGGTINAFSEQIVSLKSCFFHSFPPYFLGLEKGGESVREETTLVMWEQRPLWRIE